MVVFSSTFRGVQMKHLISWFDIPVVDFDKALAFYQAIFQIEMPSNEMGGCLMGFFPSGDVNVSGAIVKHEQYKPSQDGVVIYFHCDNIEEVLDRVPKAGGTITLGKTLISPEIGYFAFFLDVDGNRLALHSKE